MPTHKTHVDQIIIALTEDGQVRGMAKHMVSSVYDEDGTLLAAHPVPACDVSADEVRGILDPVLVTQRTRIADLTAQLEAAKKEAAEAAEQSGAALAAAKHETTQAASKAAAELSAAQAQTGKATQRAETQAKHITSLEGSLRALQGSAQRAVDMVLSALPQGRRAMWKLTYEQIIAAIVDGDVELARNTVATMADLYPGIQAERAALLALLAPTPDNAA